MKKKRSKNDAYYSYRWRCQKAGKPFMTVEEFWHSRKTGPKKKDGSYLPEWNRKGTRVPLIWMSKFNSLDKLKSRRVELLNNLLTNTSRRQQIRNQLYLVELVIDFMKEL